MVGYDGVELLDVAGVTSTLDLANRLGAEPGYQVSVVSPGRCSVVCQSGLSLQAQERVERCTGPLDLLIVTGGFDHRRAAADRRIVGHVRRLARESRRVASVCTGASILAAAGLLDGKRATTHWAFADELANRYPQVTVDSDPIFIRDGNVYTAAGITSALDLTLALVEEDHGVELARNVARVLVTYLQRPGNQAQMSMHLSAPSPQHDVVRTLVSRIQARPDDDLTTAALAATAGVSQRHLTRLFVEHLGQTPGRFVRRTRIEASAQLLASTTLPTAQVASRCGFRSAEALRQAFIAQYGISPSRYRATQSGQPSRRLHLGRDAVEAKAG